MKKILSSGILTCMIGLSPAVCFAQTPLIAERGGFIDLNAPDGYQSYQWQVSSDAENFVDIPEAKGQKLHQKVFAPGYYRVKALDDKYYSHYPDTTEVKMTALNYNEKYSVTGGAHGFVESLDGRGGAKGINIPEDREGNIAGTSLPLTSWTNGDARAVYFFHHPQDVVDTEMLLTVRNNKRVAFRVSVWDPMAMDAPLAENIVALTGTGKEQKVPLIGLSFSHSHYYRYQLECIKGWKDIVEISKFHHYSPSAEETYKSGYLSSPSVHLNGWNSSHLRAPKGKVYDWCYLEVMMPKSSDIPGTYVMSLGVLKGYMGIQMNGYQANGEPLHDVIFSMWDDGNTDNNPNLPLYLRANVLDINKKATATRFGNEGTGMKTFLSGNHWNSDTFVQFITNCRAEKATYKVKVNGKEEIREQDNILVSTWFNAQDGKGWQYMATLRLPNHDDFFDSWYSFLENYNYPTGQILRKGYYRNGYGHSVAKNQWFHFNRVNFGHTDGGNGKGARQDYGQGTTDDYDKTFFMTTGGFIDANVTRNNVPINRVHTPVDTINMAALEARVDQAIENERKQIELEESFRNKSLDKTGWEVISFSSEETSGEGDNGRAEFIIDNDLSTYWHSQWKDNKAPYPHTLVVDMKKEYDLTAMQISMSGGTSRYIKSFNLYFSKDNLSWEKVYTENDAPEKSTFNFSLPKTTTARYFKLEVTSGRATEGPFVRINEIDLTEAPQTGLNTIEEAAQWGVRANQDKVLVTAPTSLSNVTMTLYRADGSCLSTNTFASLDAGETINLPLLAATKGVYLLTFNYQGKKITRQFILN